MRTTTITDGNVVPFLGHSETLNVRISIIWIVTHTVLISPSNFDKKDNKCGRLANSLSKMTAANLFTVVIVKR